MTIVPVERSRYTMGTTASVRIEALGTSATASREGAAAVAELALDRIDEVDRAASLYRPDSDLVRVNHESWPGPSRPGPLLLDLIRISLRYARLTHGSFDPTIKPLMDQLGFYRELGSTPDPGGLAGALERVGWKKVALEQGSVRFLRRGMAFDLGGIGKGYALDRAAALLRERGVTAAQIELGRSWYFLGESSGSSDGRFGLEIASPEDTPESAGRIAIRVPEGSVATSAPYSQMRLYGGRRVGHIVDPRRGPIDARVESATVWARTGVEAEVLGKVLVLKGPAFPRGLARSFRFEAILLSGNDSGPGTGQVGTRSPSRSEILATPGLVWRREW